ncbi:hypothetical protein N665_0383s0044 [Sinapis alba]|nr:hypothetical protein N665_0383s0044 [Sinapis alba]
MEEVISPLKELLNVKRPREFGDGQGGRRGDIIKSCLGPRTDVALQAKKKIARSPYRTANPRKRQAMPYEESPKKKVLDDCNKSDEGSFPLPPLVGPANGKKKEEPKKAVIDVSVTIDGNKIYISFVYGDPIINQIQYVWEQLAELVLHALMYGLWLVILTKSMVTMSESSFIDFRLMQQNCGMIELPYSGDCFSWVQRRHNYLVRCRLDRAMGNAEWFSLYSSASSQYLRFMGSDHRPIITHLSSRRGKGWKKNRFDKRFTSKSGFENIVREGWVDIDNNNDISFYDGLRNVGRLSLDSVEKKIIIPKRSWKNSKINSIGVKWTRQCQRPKCFQYGINYKRHMKKNNLSGERNTKFYHATTEHCRARNHINGLNDSRGVWCENERKIKVIAKDYFEEIFSSSSPSDIKVSLNHVKNTISPEMSESLCKEVSSAEIKKKAVLCQRLKRYLPSIISETQSAFVAGRVIADNILLAQEAFHALRTNNKCKNEFMAIKTDMSKAYNRVEWDFLEAVMGKKGFHGKWIQWIMRCVRSVSYRVLINGNPTGHITPTWGLRQGDPLSPYLFILCTEVLIANIRNAETS